VAAVVAAWAVVAETPDAPAIAAIAVAPTTMNLRSLDMELRSLLCSRHTRLAARSTITMATGT
jgi:hypothetical protein